VTINKINGFFISFENNAKILLFDMIGLEKEFALLLN